MRFAMLLLLMLPGLASAQIRLDAYSLASGGILEGPTLRAELTLGQPFVGQLDGADTVAQAGFWFVEGAPVPTPVGTYDALPGAIRLGPNYPNPFNPQTTIRYALPAASPVRLAVFDVLGREVDRLVDEVMPAGVYDVVFEARDLPSGVYFYRLEAGATTQTGKMLLIK